MEKKIDEYEVIEFKKDYETQVIDLVGRELRSWGVLSQSRKPISDADLYNISEIYTGRSRFWIVLIKGKVVGTAGVRELEEKKAKLSRMFVLDEYHGTGIGQTLLDKALAFAKEQGYEELVLNTHPRLTRAHRFYEKNGFILEVKDKERFHFKLKL